LLLQARENLAHGQWLPWLGKCGLVERTAQLYMYVAKNWPKIREKSQRCGFDFATLGLNDVLRLLRLPKAPDDAPKPVAPAYPQAVASPMSHAAKPSVKGSATAAGDAPDGKGQRKPEATRGATQFPLRPKAATAKALPAPSLATLPTPRRTVAPATPVHPGDDVPPPKENPNMLWVMLSKATQLLTRCVAPAHNTAHSIECDELLDEIVRVAVEIKKVLPHA